MEEIELEEDERLGVAKGLSLGLAEADERVESTFRGLRMVACRLAGSAVAVVADMIVSV